MAKGILGKKLGMTQIFEADGRQIGRGGEVCGGERTV